MKSYAETVGEKVIDYKALLSKPVISLDDWGKINFGMGSWDTCFIGIQSELIPRDSSGRPNDEILQKLGLLNCWMDDEDAESGLNLLSLIELRCEFILNGVKKSLEKDIAYTKDKLNEMQKQLDNINGGGPY